MLQNPGEQDWCSIIQAQRINSGTPELPRTETRLSKSASFFFHLAGILLSKFLTSLLGLREEGGTGGNHGIPESKQHSCYLWRCHGLRILQRRITWRERPCCARKQSSKGKFFCLSEEKSAALHKLGWVRLVWKLGKKSSGRSNQSKDLTWMVKRITGADLSSLSVFFLLGWGPQIQCPQDRAGSLHPLFPRHVHQRHDGVQAG